MFDFTRGFLYRITHLTKASYQSTLEENRNIKVIDLNNNLGLDYATSYEKKESEITSPKQALPQQYNEGLLIKGESRLTELANTRMKRFLRGYAFLSRNESKNLDNDIVTYRIKPYEFTGLKSYQQSRSDTR